MKIKSDIPADLAPLWAAATEKAGPGRLVLITEAFECLARLRQVREQLDKEPLLVTSERSKMSRANPLLATEAKLRDQLTKLWSLANLSKTTLPQAHPPGHVAFSRSFDS